MGKKKLSIFLMTYSTTALPWFIYGIKKESSFRELSIVFFIPIRVERSFFMNILVLRVKIGNKEYINVCRNGEEAKGLYLDILMKNFKNSDLKADAFMEMIVQFNKYYMVRMHGVEANCYVRSLDTKDSELGLVPSENVE